MIGCIDKEGRGWQETFLHGPIIEDEYELEEWDTLFREQIRKAKEMRENLLEGFQIAKDEVGPVRDHADERRAGSWNTRLEDGLVTLLALSRTVRFPSILELEKTQSDRDRQDQLVI